MLEKCTGGAPGTSPAVDKQYRQRSPIEWLPRAKGLPIHIETGIRDGQEGSVPVSQSLIAFNTLVENKGDRSVRFTNAEIDRITREKLIPPGPPPQTEPDRRFPALLRRTSGPVTITIFDGAHETDFPTAVRWLKKQ